MRGGWWLVTVIVIVAVGGEHVQHLGPVQVHGRRDSFGELSIILINNILFLSSVSVGKCNCNLGVSQLIRQPALPTVRV